MAICLEYQAVYANHKTSTQNWCYLLGASVLLFLALSLKVALKVQLTDLGYRLASQEQLAVEYDTERRDLELQLSILKRPETLAEQAKQRLQLEDFNSERVRVL
jgi:hypothetical protein